MISIRSFFSAVMLMTILVLTSGFMCRDCPFPAKIADGKWELPNGQIHLEIDELNRPKDFDAIYVTLRDSKSGVVLAKGVTYQRRGRKTLNIELIDNEGRSIRGYVHYLDNEKEKINAKFTCRECKIESRLDGGGSIAGRPSPDSK